MSLLRNITSGLRSLFRKEQVDRELNEELGVYLEMEAAEKMKQGMSRKDALRAVRLERGGVELAKEVVRSGSWESLVDTLWRDLLFAVRMLRRNPGSTAAVEPGFLRSMRTAKSKSRHSVSTRDSQLPERTTSFASSTPPRSRRTARRASLRLMPCFIFSAASISK